MKKLVLAAAMVAGATLGLESVSFGHGGQYRGPGDTVPPAGGGSGGGGAGPTSGPSGPSSPGPAGPGSPAAPGAGAPGAAPGAAPTSGGPQQSGPDLTVWSFWWEFNKDPYLNLREKIQSGATETGTDGWFLGKGQKVQGKDSLKPTEAQIREKVVPALLNALANETNNDIVTGSMIALAKIGDAPSEDGESKFEKVIAAFLADKNQEISETAAVSLGILANPASIPTLEHLLMDDSDGRKLVGSNEVNYRTRAFAAYGLGLIGATTGEDADRQNIVRILATALESDDTKARDLAVSCVIAMGLVPLDTITADATPEDKDELLPPQASRLAQIDYLLGYMADDNNNFLVTAHCPTAVARLLAAEGIPYEQHAAYREKVAEALLANVAKRTKAKVELQQGSVQALGLIGKNDGKNSVDKDIRKALAAVPDALKDQQARNYALISMAKVGGAAGEENVDAGVKESAEYLLGQLSRGKQTQRPWAGLSCGVLARELGSAGHSETVASLKQAVRDALKDESDKQRIGAYAVSCGIMGDLEAEEVLLRQLKRGGDDEARGYVAIALGLMNSRSSIKDIQDVVKDSKYRPDLLKQAAISLGLLGDKELVIELTTMLQEAKGLATQAAISSALGFIGDRRSIDPLVEMLQNSDLAAPARGFAAVALGIVADKELLPWNSKIALDLNYLASTETLTNQSSGTGILDIL